MTEVLSPMSGFPAWVSGSRSHCSQSIWVWRPVGSECRSSTGLGEMDSTLGRAHTRSHAYWFLFSTSVLSDSLWPHELQHARPPCPSPTPGACSNSCSLSWWCHPTISSTVVPFSSCLQSFPASGFFPVSQLFASGSQILELHLQTSPSSGYYSEGQISFKND